MLKILTNKQVISRFLRGESGQGRSLMSDGHTLSTNGEPIAARADNGREITIHTSREVQGRLAARHRSMVREMASHVRVASDLRQIAAIEE